MRTAAEKKCMQEVCAKIVVKDVSTVKGAPIIDSLLELLTIHEENLENSKYLIRKPHMHSLVDVGC